MALQQIAPSIALDAERQPKTLGGLLGLDGDREVTFPLRSVRVRATMAGDCCRTVVEQLFSNPHPKPLEAVHIFPLPDDGAVTEMELRAGEVVVRAQCLERQEAEQKFDAARRTGRRAALLTAERSDVHTLRVTNVPPHTDVTVRLVIVERLESIDGRFGWRFPTVVAPRYTPGREIGHSGEGVTPDTDRAPDASRLQPPLRLAGGARLDLEVEISGGVSAVTSSLHAVHATFGEHVRVAPSVQATLDRDFILRFEYESRVEQPVRSFTDGTHTLVVLQPPTDVAPVLLPRDAVFVIDVSGSMLGQKLQAASRALRAALRGLDSADRFRLIAFGSDHISFAPNFTPYTADALARAEAWIGALTTRGGTEMLGPLLEAFSGDTSEGRVRTVLFITDGQATDDEEVIAAVARSRRSARLFTVGIDTAVNSALLRRLARTGGGVCELLTPSDDVEDAIARIESRFGSPILEAVAIEHADAARPEAAVVFEGRPLTILVRGDGAGAVVRARQADRDLSWPVPPPVKVDGALGALWARDRVGWLEDRLTRGEPGDHRAAIVQLGVKYGIATRFTAFVAVESTVTVEGGELVKIVQPVELPAEWDARGAVALMAGAPVSRPASGVFAVSSITPYAPAPPSPNMGSPVPHASMRGPASSVGSAIRSRLAELPSLLKRSAKPSEGRPSAPSSPASADSPSVEERDPRRAIESRLALTQQADGSFGGDVERTAAAVLALLALGHTRRTGSRRRVVMKAVAWLDAHRSHPLAVQVIDAVNRREAGGDLVSPASFASIGQATDEGRLFARAMALPR